MKTNSTLPRPWLHRASGQSRVRLNNSDIYLGPWGSPEADAEYARVIRTWLAAGRQWPPPQHITLTVAEIIAKYTAWAAAYYTKAGRPTKTAANIARATELLGYVRTSAAEPVITALDPALISPRHLTSYQAYLAADPARRWSLTTINDYTSLVVGMFRWAAANELCPAPVWQALQSVRPLARGRSPAPGIAAPRQPRTVQPVPEAHLDATLAKAHPMLAAMIRLQLATGMRPIELCHLRPLHVNHTTHPDVWAYHVPPEANKTEHKGRARTVYMGPRAIAILREWMPKDPAAYIFRPIAARLMYLATIPASRRRKPPEQHRQHYADHYTTDAYRQAIWKTCARVCKDLPAGQRWRWSPNQLRHNAASFIAKHESVQIARILLGHADIATTMNYVDVAQSQAVQAALRLA